MKKVFLVLIAGSIGLFAYSVTDSGGGRCDNGATFAISVDNEGWYTVVAGDPKGYGNSPSKDKAIKEACGE